MNWDTFSLFVIVYFLAVSVIYLVMFIISFWAIVNHHLRARFATPNEILKAKITPPVSVLLPAYNEEKTIIESVLSMTRMAYPEFEIIVINDGSPDNTLKVLSERFKLRKTRRVYRKQLESKPVRGIYRSAEVPNLLVIDKENGGKADALNVGINASTYPLVASLDADSMLERHSLLRVVHPFMEAFTETVGVGGIVRAANGCRIERGEVLEARLSSNWLVNFQVVEYLRAFLSGRMGWSLMNALLVISGAFGLFKKEPILQVGGYRHDVVGEDMELVVRLHKHFSARKERYRFHFIPDPVCWTEVPEVWRVLSRQRNRWQRGLAESLYLHLSMLFNPFHGWIGLAAMPYFLFVECLSPLVEVAGYAVFAAAIASGAANWESFRLFFSLAVLFGVLLSLLAILMEEVSLERYPKLEDLAKLIISGVAENFGYRQALALVRTKALWDYMRKVKSWGAMERKGFSTTAVLLLLSASGAARAASPVSRLSVSQAYEHQSFTPLPARITVVEAEGPLPGGKVDPETGPAVKLLARATRLQRFGFIDGSGTLGFSARLPERRGVSGEASFAPDGIVLPRFSTAWYFYQGIGKTQLIPAFAHSSFELAKTYLLSVGATHPVLPWLEAGTRLFLGFTAIKNGPTHGNPAVLGTLRASRKEGWILPSYSFRGESFEAGRPGAAGRFHAHSYGLRAGIETPLFEVMPGFEYEDRTNDTFLRRYELSLQRRF